MDQVKAQEVVTAVVAAGLNATVSKAADGSWTVIVTASDFTIDSADIASFVTAHGVIGKARNVLLT
jgi:hypothetical protein